ncbi:MAG TPA: peptidoglycan-binding domain-containing protein [Pseudolabrys sp.]|nr:peptidoglycan-binding domain-containing protein [Pseudolabrys sp.]
MPKQSRREEAETTSRAGALAAAIGRHPREFVGVLMAGAATTVIFVNALFLQKGPHPAPIFASRPLLKQAAPAAPAQPQSQTAQAAANDPAAQKRAQLISNIQRELSRRGFYDGAVDGLWGARTDGAARDFADAAHLRLKVEPSEGLLHAVAGSNVHAAASSPARANDPIAELIAPSKSVLAIQRALADFGYGQVAPTGVYDPATRAAIEKFERERNLPVTGQISDRFVRELSAMTGRPLE